MSYKLYIEDNVTPPAIVWSDQDPGSGYTDYTGNIEKWDSFAPSYVNDNTIREKIKSLIQVIAGTDYSTWSSVQPADKAIASKWKVAPYSLRVPDECTESDDQTEWQEVMKDVETARIGTYLEMRLTVSQYVRVETLSRTDSEDFFSSVMDLADQYVYANTRDLHDWIDNTVGSAYENAGFAEKSYYSAAIRDAILSKCNGEY